MPNKQFVTFILLLSVLSSAARTIYKERRLSVTDGLPSNTVNCITQDRDGYIWIGTSYGLSRYDGYTFHNYYSLSPRKDKAGHSVALLYYQEPSPLLWVYTPQRIMACFDLEQSRFVDYTGKGDEERSYYKRDLFASGLWMGDGTNGLRHPVYKDGRFSVEDMTKEGGHLPANDGLSVCDGESGVVWISTSKGIVRHTPEGNSYVAKGKNIREFKYLGKRGCYITVEGEAAVIDSNGKTLLTSHLDPSLGDVKYIGGSAIVGNIWYIFGAQKTFAMDMTTGRFSCPKNMQWPGAALKYNFDNTHILTDNNGNVFFLFETKAKVFNVLDIDYATKASTKNITVAKDKKGRFIIATYGNGIFVYDPAADTVDHYSANDADREISHNFFRDVFVDRNDGIWLSSSAGVYYLTETTSDDVAYVLPEPGASNDWSNYVRYLTRAGERQIVLSTRNNKLYSYDASNGSLNYLRDTEGCVYCYFTDSDGHVWMCTRGGGLYLDDRHYTKSDPTYKVPVNSFYKVCEDRSGRIWIASWEGGLLQTRYSSQPLSFTTYLNNEYGQRRIHDMIIDKNQRLWIATDDGLYTVDVGRKNISGADFDCFNTENGRLPVDEIVCLYIDRGGALWLGSNGGLLKCSYDSREKKLSYQRYTTKEGMGNNNIRSLVEDQFGNFWVGTEEGVSCINRQTPLIKTYMFSTNLSSNTYSDGAVQAMPDGRLFFGTVNGMMILRPHEDNHSINNSNKTDITDLFIDGVSIYDLRDDISLEKALNASKKVVLPHNCSNLQIYFSDFNYSDARSTLYQYYLEGVDKKWRPLTSMNHADYSDLTPGRYTFHLRARTGIDQWSEETTIDIRIRQPWYNTWWAWFIYLAVIAAVAAYMYRAWKKNFQLRQQIRMDKQLHEFRVSFFTNISHEFRTPLAIIQGAVSRITENADGAPPKSAVQSLKRGTDRMLRMINQLLEFRKINTSSINIQVEDGDLIPYVRNIFHDFRTLAGQKEMNFTFTPFAKHYTMKFDYDKVEMVVYNLISNALKYTPEKGSVTVRVTKDDDSAVKIIVEDDGPGISPERQEKLFKPFMEGQASKGGMGIGLFSAHQMAEAHHGSLTYATAPEGGSIFTFTLPAAGYAYTEEETSKNTVDRAVDDSEDYEEMAIDMVDIPVNDITVMIVEDEPDMLIQEKKILSVFFKVEGYTTARAALDSLADHTPSLIVSDITLPDISGLQFVSQLKADAATRHIPVIMLTVLDDENTRLRAMKAGADDYMVKPCSKKLLTTRALQLIKRRMTEEKELSETIQSMQADSNAGASSPAPSQSAGGDDATLIMSAGDKSFITRLDDTIEAHLSEADFNVDKLADILKVGRTKLFYKVKEMTGMSPNAYIQEKRLVRAAGLVVEGTLTVNEISDRVGFQNTTYFSRCFKQKYGVSPSKYTGQ